LLKLTLSQANFLGAGMKIGEVARKAGIAPSAIRFYERIGLLPRVSRQGGQRRFSADLELYLAIIEFARKAGFTIAEIKFLFHGFRKGTPASARWRRLARKKSDELDLQIARLKSVQELLKKTMRCHCINLENCGRILLSRHKDR
jgi:MerR family transcriptional regulator, redox-sensitive transcriptional activator SoxR